MKKGIIYSFIAGLIALLYGCGAQLYTYDLSKDYATSLHYQPSENEEEPEEEESSLVGIPARNFYNGDLKRGGIWWASKGITLEKGEVFILEVTHIGSDSTPLGATNPAIDLPATPFGATFPPIDLITEEVMVKISARAEGENGAVPVLHLQVDDAGGYQANAKRPAHQILNTEDFQDYYFDMRDIYMQSEPKKHKVNGALINSMKFFINPGQAPYTGKILIREIKVVPVQKN